jgi:hypothetical protein
VTVEPRPWITLEDLTDEDQSAVLCPLPDSVNETAAQAGIDIASAILYELTGRRWSGIENGVVRPSAQDSSLSFLVPDWVPAWGSYDSLEGACVPSNRIDIGYYPVLNVTQVRLNGVVVAANTYQLQNRKDLVRVDGGVWPCSQDLFSAPTQPDTFEISFVHGIEPPEAGKLACAVYAVELAKSFCNLDCALPQRTQYATRQGISTIMLDPLNVIERGMIGLPTVDSWVRAVNPYKRRKRAMMMSGKDIEPSCRPPLSVNRLGVDFYGYPNRGINDFCG